MVYDANPNYYLGVPAIPQIVVELYTGIGIDLYESGEIDMTGVSSANWRVCSTRPIRCMPIWSAASACAPITLPLM